MQTYKEKLINGIRELPEEQAHRFYLIFQAVKEGFKLPQNADEDWKKDFKSISVWDGNNFDEIRERFNQWQIEEF